LNPYREIMKEVYKIAKSDTPEARAQITRALNDNNIVYDEDEKRIITKATMGQLNENSNVGIMPAIRGG